jgi:hypothetical protein
MNSAAKTGKRLGEAVGEHERQDELVPRDAEREDGGHREARAHQREDDAEQHLEEVGAVDDGRLLELHRDLTDEAEQQPDGERQVEGRVEEHQPELAAVEEVAAAEAVRAA